jgi:hypothetical protein
MSVRSKMPPPPILPGTRSATSSLELEDGATPFDSLVGQMIDPSGPEAALASLSARQAKAKAKGLLTSGTYGPHGIGSSASVVLTSSLVSKLRTVAIGSTLYRQTWKEKATPSGRRYWGHTASAPRTSDSGCIGWPTPNTPSGGRSVSIDKMDATGRTKDGKKHTASLEHAVKFVGWPTPVVNDATGSQYSYSQGNHDKPVLKLPGAVQLTSSAATASAGQLNPEFSRWLMGYPAVWGSCGATAMQLLRHLPRSSSKRACRAE